MSQAVQEPGIQLSKIKILGMRPNVHTSQKSLSGDVPAKTPSLQQLKEKN